MTLAQKIQGLRKKCGMSQETLAEQCGVSRQSVSKWEADIALPEMEKLLIIGRLFKVSMDYLMIDALEDEEAVKMQYSCHAQCEGKDAVKQLYYEGILIKESLRDENILDQMNVQKVELWRTMSTPKYWTALYFKAEGEDFPEALSKALKSCDEEGTNWFCDMKRGPVKWIVFQKQILNYMIGNEEEKAAVCQACKNLGIPDSQMNWPE